MLERSDVRDAFERVAKRLGHRMRAAREQRGWNQEEAAERMGVHPKQVQRMEAGRTNCTLAALVAASVALEIPLAELLADEAPEDGQ